MKRTLASFLAATISLGLGIAASAATWTGVGDMIWTQPDTNSFDVTYNSGDAVSFAGAGTGTVTVAGGGVDPASLTISTSGYTFGLPESDALGTGNLVNNLFNSTITFNNTSAGEITLANNLTYTNLYSLVFTGGDLRFTGTINGGGNGGPAFKPATGVTVTVDNGITGNDFAKYDAGILRIMAASTGKLASFNGGTIEVHHDQALGLGTDQFSTSGVVTLVAGSGARTLAQNAHFRNVNIDGANDLTLNGTIVGGDAFTFRKYGTGTCTLNGNNSTWGDNIHIHGGTLVAGHANAFGTGSVTVYTGGTLGIGPAVILSKAVTWNTGSGIAGSGTYQRATSWTVPTLFTVAPGLSTGTLTLDVGSSNTVTLRSDTILEFEFAGASDYDKLVVSNGGILNLAGATLDLTFLDGYKPSFGQTFDVFSATTINNDIVGLTGDYATMFTWDISGGVLTLTSQVPEPASLSLLALAGLLVMKRRRRL